MRVVNQRVSSVKDLVGGFRNQPARPLPSGVNHKLLFSESDRYVGSAINTGDIPSRKKRDSHCFFSFLSTVEGPG